MPPISNFIKKRGENIYKEGGLGQNPRKEKQQNKIKATTDYGNL